MDALQVAQRAVQKAVQTVGPRAILMVARLVEWVLTLVVSMVLELVDPMVEL